MNEVLVDLFANRAAKGIKEVTVQTEPLKGQLSQQSKHEGTRGTLPGTWQTQPRMYVLHIDPLIVCACDCLTFSRAGPPLPARILVGEHKG